MEYLRQEAKAIAKGTRKEIQLSTGYRSSMDPCHLKSNLHLMEKAKSILAYPFKEKFQPWA